MMRNLADTETASRGDPPKARLAEVIAALSLATGLGMGQPMELPLRAAKLGVEIGRQLNLGTTDLSDVYYLALVVHIGCTSDALEFAGFAGGDDLALRQHTITWPNSEPPQLLSDMVRHVGQGRPPVERARLVAQMLVHGRERGRQVAITHCQAATRLAERLGLSAGVRAGLAQEQERWDGKGIPDGLAGEQLTLAKRIVAVAHDAIVLSSTGGSVPETLRARRGRAYDPTIVDAFLDLGGAQGLDPAVDAWAEGLAAEPEPLATIDAAGIDRVALACADFADLS